MSLSNKMAKFGKTNGFGYPTPGARLLGPPAQVGNGRYMGDPGLFSFLGRAVRGVAGVVGQIAGAATGLSGLFGGRAAIPGASTIPGPILMPRPMPRFPVAMPGAPGVAVNIAGPQFVPRGMGVFPQVPRPGVGAAVERFLPGGQTGMMPAPSATMGGFHLNKTSYFLKDGTYIEAGTKWVKNRRRNPGNMRALSRSMARLKSAKKMAAVLGTVTIRKKCPA